MPLFATSSCPSIAASCNSSLVTKISELFFSQCHLWFLLCIFLKGMLSRGFSQKFFVNNLKERRKWIWVVGSFFKIKNMHAMHLKDSRAVAGTFCSIISEGLGPSASPDMLDCLVPGHPFNLKSWDWSNAQILFSAQGLQTFCCLLTLGSRVCFKSGAVHHF